MELKGRKPPFEDEKGQYPSFPSFFHPAWLSKLVGFITLLLCDRGWPRELLHLQWYNMDSVALWRVLGIKKMSQAPAMEQTSPGKSSLAYCHLHGCGSLGLHPHWPPTLAFLFCVRNGDLCPILVGFLGDMWTQTHMFLSFLPFTVQWLSG